MRLLASLFLFCHGISHLAGFRAAFWTANERTELLGGALSVGALGNRALGVVWLLLAVGYMAASALLLFKNAHWTRITLSVTAISAAMCLLFWPDARVGLFVDSALFVAVLWISRSSSEHLASVFARELRTADLPSGSPSPELVDEAAIASLPEPVRRYLRFMGVVGRPRDWSLKARFDARFRRAPGAWLPCEALQYDNRLKLSRFFYMRLALSKVLPVTVRDTYSAGRGSMLVKAFDLFRVVEGSGRELDLGELVTYLNDAILLAPSLLLGPETSWKALDQNCFEVTLTDGRASVSARVRLDEHGAPIDFSTTDRYFDTPGGERVRTEWRTPVSGWQEVAGRRLPTHAQAVWELPTGPFPYADFTIDPAKIAFNVPPTGPAR